jgi:hypothetical protein
MTARRIIGFGFVVLGYWLLAKAAGQSAFLTDLILAKILRNSNIFFKDPAGNGWTAAASAIQDPQTKNEKGKT